MPQILLFLVLHGGAYTGPGEAIPPATAGPAITGPIALAPPKPPAPELVVTLADRRSEADQRRQALAELASRLNGNVLPETEVLVSYEELERVRGIASGQALVDYARCLGYVGKRGQEHLQLLVRRNDPYVKAEATYQLVRMDKEGGEKLAREVLRSAKHPVEAKIAALRGLADRGSPFARPEALMQLRNPEALLVLEALDFLRRTPTQEDVPYLIKLLDSSHGRAAGLSHELLKKITGFPIGPNSKEWKLRWLMHQAKNEEFVNKIETAPQETLAFMGAPIYGKNVVFLLDLSGSMQGSLRASLIPSPGATPSAAPAPTARSSETRGQRALRELRAVLGKLPKDGFFDIIGFTQNLTSFTDDSMARSSRVRIQSAATWLQDQSFIGATDLYAALEIAFARNKMQELIILTDGVPSAGVVQQPSRLLNYVRRWNRWRHVRISTVSLGAPGSAHEFLRQIAQQNYGQIKSVY